MPAIGASGVLGIALETVPGTYVAPTKFFPIDSESLNYTEDQKQRRPIRNTPGLVDISAGNAHVEGDISFDVLPEVLIYFLVASRYTINKTGTTAPYTYVCTPSAVAVAGKTMSVSIRKGTEVFGFTGCVVNSLTLTIDDSGDFKGSVSVIGNNEASAAALTAITWPTTKPFGVGNYTIESPTGTPILDTSTYEFTAEHGGEPQFRIKNSGKGASFIKFGEETATISVTRDFENRSEYDQFKSLTSRSLTFSAASSASNSIEVESPVSIADSYEVALGGQGDLVSANISYQCVINAAGNPYTITVITGEDVTLT